MNFSQFQYITFDCYGTLIDWESGILGVLRPMLRSHRLGLNDQGILELYAAIESRLEAGPYLPYRQVLEMTVERLAARLGFAATAEEMASLPESVRIWTPFPDTVRALARLKVRYKLAILSNIDDDLFAGSAKRLEVPFDQVVTAQQVGSYKPTLKNFEVLLERIGVPREAVLHVAQSRFHDIRPAKQLGLSTVWVNRRRDRRGTGATPAATGGPEPDLTVLDLSELARIVLGD